MSRIVDPGGPGRVPIHAWGRTVPEEALRQLQELASQHYVVEHVAAMPDLHVASGIAVGSVFATEATLVPAALGVEGVTRTAPQFPSKVSAICAERYFSLRRRSGPRALASSAG